MTVEVLRRVYVSGPITALAAVSPRRKPTQLSFKRRGRETELTSSCSQETQQGQPRLNLDLVQTDTISSVQ
ncbi:unnamed protein product [Boreogadus saida]